MDRWNGRQRQRDQDSSYRPALDGLRALAVVSVMLYHGEVRWARGGFLGVDLFFVLSGYLITSLLIREWDDGGHIALGSFWARRARRLLPALFLVLGAVAVYGATLAPATKLRALRWDGLATLAYSANWRFISNRTSYFDQFSDPSPLTHMWSLGIEEQYYVVWPLVVAGVLWAMKGRLAPLLAGALVAACLSALDMAALYHPGRDPSRAYFGTDSRAQELLIGAILAIALARGRDARMPARVADGLGLAGLAGVLTAMVLVPDSAAWMYRGGFALLAFASALAVIAAARPESGVIGRLLAIPPLPATGRISYGLYLWHWPLYVVLSPARTHLLGVRLLGLRLAVTLVVAVLSYRLVELPIRRGGLRRRQLARPVTAGAAASVASVLILATLGAQTAGAATGAATTASGAAFGDPGHPVGVSAGIARKAQPRAGVGLSAYLVGDSVAFSLGSNFQQASVPGMSLQTDAIVGCGVARAPNVVDGETQPLNPACLTWPRLWSLDVTKVKPDVTVMVIGAWEIYDKKVDGQVLTVGSPRYAQYLNGELQTAYDILSRDSGRIAVLNVPCYHQENTGSDGAAAQIRDDPARGAWLNQLIGRFVAEHSAKMSLVDLRDFLCPGGQYVARMDGVQVRDDGVHFTPDGADVVWRWLGPILRKLASG
jgi:peptidoglycan/LPS O-acetylase OafA/YrhL